MYLWWSRARELEDLDDDPRRLPRGGDGDRAREAVVEARPAASALSIRRASPPPNREEGRVFKRIVVGTDGSDTAAVAVEQAIGLAKATGASIDVVTAFEPSTPQLATEEKVEVPGDVQYEAGPRQEVNLI